MSKKIAIVFVCAFALLGLHTVHAQTVDPAQTMYNINKVDIKAGPLSSDGPITVPAGSVMVHWQSWNSNQMVNTYGNKPCVGYATPARSDFAGSYVSTGDIFFNQTVSTVYTITCGNVSDNVVVNIQGQPTISVDSDHSIASGPDTSSQTSTAAAGTACAITSFTEDPNPVAFNGLMNFHWSVANPTKCESIVLAKVSHQSAPQISSANVSSEVARAVSKQIANLPYSPTSSGGNVLNQSANGSQDIWALAANDTFGAGITHAFNYKTVTVNVAVSGVGNAPATTLHTCGTATGQTPCEVILVGTGSTASGQISCTDLPNDLLLGSGGILNASNTANVTALQRFLISEGYLSSDSATGYFGLATQHAVIFYQTKSAIKPPEGYVGALTRAQIKAISCGNPSIDTTPDTSQTVHPGTSQTNTPSQSTGQSPVITFNLDASSNPSATILQGDAVLLSWRVEPSTSSLLRCTGSGAGNGLWNGSGKPLIGIDAVTPTVDTTYTLSCTSPSGNASKSVTVHIGGERTVVNTGSDAGADTGTQSPGSAGTVDLKVNGSNLSAGNTSSLCSIISFTADTNEIATPRQVGLHWRSSDGAWNFGTNCGQYVLSGPNVNQVVNSTGDALVTVSQSSYFLLSSQNGDSSSIIIKVAGVSPDASSNPICSITSWTANTGIANDGTTVVPYGGSVTLSWTTSHCTIGDLTDDAQIHQTLSGSQIVSGSITLSNITKTTSRHLYASGVGAATKGILIQVSGQSASNQGVQSSDHMAVGSNSSELASVMKAAQELLNSFFH